MLRASAVATTLSIACVSLLVPLARSAIVEVMGSSGTSPTYKFSDESGAALATLVGSSTKIAASVDIETNSASVNDLATRLAAAEATMPSGPSPSQPCRQSYDQ